MLFSSIHKNPCKRQIKLNFSTQKKPQLHVLNNKISTAIPKMTVMSMMMILSSDFATTESDDVGCS